MSPAAGREQDAIDLLVQADALTNDPVSEAMRLANLSGGRAD